MTGKKRYQKTRASRNPSPRVSPPRLSKSIRQQAELWTDFFNLAMEKLIEEGRGPTANRECVKVAGDIADEALEVYEARWPGVYL